MHTLVVFTFRSICQVTFPWGTCFFLSSSAMNIKSDRGASSNNRTPSATSRNSKFNARWYRPSIFISVNCAAKILQVKVRIFYQLEKLLLYLACICSGEIKQLWSLFRRLTNALLSLATCWPMVIGTLKWIPTPIELLAAGGSILISYLFYSSTALGYPTYRHRKNLFPRRQNYWPRFHSANSLVGSSF